MENDAVEGVHLCTLREGVYRGPHQHWQFAFGGPDRPAPEGRGRYPPTGDMHSCTPRLRQHKAAEIQLGNKLAARLSKTLFGRRCGLRS
jgi:hypothetical protein